jgi:hypothetical protein
MYCTSLSYKAPAEQQRNGTIFFRKIFLKARADLRNSAVIYPLYLTGSPLLIATLAGAEWTASRPVRQQSCWLQMDRLENRSECWLKIQVLCHAPSNI